MIVDGRWWVLRANPCFPVHDLCTLFIAGYAAADITATIDDPRALIASIAALQLITPTSDPATPVMSAALAQSVVATVAGDIVYGSESDEPCDECQLSQRDAWERMT